VLDVGCGGGLLAEEFARLGYQVTGIDPSVASLATARAHMQQSGLHISYQQGMGEKLPFANSSFNMVACCDVLEHVDDLNAVIAEIARVLIPGGLFFFDTINRNPLTWFAHIKLAQDWSLTSFMPRNLHDWHKFITPRELRLYLQANRLALVQLRGMLPQLNPLSTIALFVAQKRHKITLDEMGKRMRFQEGRGLAQSYMGYARRLPPT
jgi:2-polyprenyl-6-hydroxyphenyl methylase / 3-demethylubiquinone-9 3-methyltransferase